MASSKETTLTRDAFIAGLRFDRKKIAGMRQSDFMRFVAESREDDDTEGYIVDFVISNGWLTEWSLKDDLATQSADDLEWTHSAWIHDTFWDVANKIRTESSKEKTDFINGVKLNLDNLKRIKRKELKALWNKAQEDAETHDALAFYFERSIIDSWELDSPLSLESLLELPWVYQAWLGEMVADEIRKIREGKR